MSTKKNISESFEITDVVVHAWHTDFIITCQTGGSVNPECLIHHIGKMVGKELENIKGLKFTITTKEEL